MLVRTTHELVQGQPLREGAQLLAVAGTDQRTELQPWARGLAECLALASESLQRGELRPLRVFRDPQARQLRLEFGHHCGVLRQSALELGPLVGAATTPAVQLQVPVASGELPLLGVDDGSMRTQALPRFAHPLWGPLLEE